MAYYNQFTGDALKAEIGNPVAVAGFSNNKAAEGISAGEFYGLQQQAEAAVIQKHTPADPSFGC